MVDERKFVKVNTYKRLTPCIFIHDGKAVKWFDNSEVLSDDVVGLAKQYCESDAKELVVFDLSETDEQHDVAINLMKQINREIHIPMLAGGNIKRLEDAKKIIYAGAKYVILNPAKDNFVDMLNEVGMRFGKDKIAISVDKIDSSVVEEYNESTIVLIEDKIYRLSKSKDMFDSKIDFSEFKLNTDGLIPVIVQHYKTDEVLMLAYMDKDAYEHTLETGKMTYYSRSRKERWVKGETSGHYQYVKSLMLDCDNDTILAKVDQIGVACHTGSPTCFFQALAGNNSKELNPLQVFESVYATIEDRKLHPKEGSYTNYLFNKGIDKILKKVGEEATELVIAAKNPNPEEIKYELSDFLYHAMVLMVERGVTWDDIVKELADR
ncbi:MAG: bifunctional phosphoribosyl-AMP cyclohydrolase/phosphoribosyl-ATP diphosphatase HisIE [Tyzzerella sp.]|nr:bifunctional phosphoribosyl-AMP cyclohydrolase/phosphoribosyl-ATP diphosphatase HisIE [Tyzzerella sp.]